MLILVLNCGSSSIKYQVVDMPAATVLARGQVERLGTPHARLHHEAHGCEPLELETGLADHRAGVELMLGVLADPARTGADLSHVEAVGHRVVHGGERCDRSLLATPEVVAYLGDLCDLAPLHNPHHLAGVAACQAALPGRPHVCVFDSAFHHTLAPEAFTYAIPHELAHRWRIRRYGFHGLAFRSAHEGAEALLGEPVGGMRVVTLMLGSGNTANACDRGRSVEVSTGFTPQEGLVQSTRAGDLDAAVVPFLMDHEGLSTAEVVDLLNRRSGWLGVSGVSADLRDILAAAREGNERAALALSVMAHRARKYVGAYAATMGGVDLLIFTGGVGEKAPSVRADICRGLEFMGLHLDPVLNEAVAEQGIISAPDSPAHIVVAKVDEELIIARDTMQVALESGAADG
jgi:acetate kinase